MPQLDDRADAVRRFNRFYTRQIGILQEHLSGSDYTLTEVRILYELAHRGGLTAADLCRELGLNAGYVSRVIAGFEAGGLVGRSRSAADGRAIELGLTERGRKTLAPIEAASRASVAALLSNLSETEQSRLLAAMADIEQLLGAPSPGYILRAPRPGDFGFIVHRQAVLYAEEYGWNDEFEALASEIVANYQRDYDSASDYCLLAERNGGVVGSVFVVRENDVTARLRMLYVDPAARGHGIGRRLVEEAMLFARRAQYQRMVLWTNSVLADARRLYEHAGFTLTSEEAHHSFGRDLVGQVFSRDL
ncbi:bifunctional helix-turn-helix transcriptional regulator/GNAT family N-acetyltransferase [Martelella endophytica]|uniref:MarR family transcriptional regulator n=1 Tax=Martelella endophytica TaxID=1486262 RepID=A0A0D5LL53_MAREN|nr:bifunctional helix-turn-helix transcriptional regulator/GNAT family N-acetyltransferase [Martelella endophytica]AJY44700.1 MarR family transcriptional regulator [Martelella endophytica]